MCNLVRTKAKKTPKTNGSYSAQFKTETINEDSTATCLIKSNG